jgi:FAD/FMN-containing dehydrogenase
VYDSRAVRGEERHVSIEADGAALSGALAAVVGERHVRTDPALTAADTTDWTGRFGGPAAAVVRPGSTEQVAAVLRVCAEHGAAVVTQGGNTGLVGGGVPRATGAGATAAGARGVGAAGTAGVSDSTRLQVVLSTRRLTRLDPVDGPAHQVTVGAGVTLAALQRHAAAAGQLYGVDLAARDSATVGGTVATNAGGIRVVRYGDTRAQVAGVEAVLADGSVISHLGGLRKDNTGYDLAGLLTGSEGTLGVLTAVRLRLHPAPAPGVVTLIGCASVQEAVELLLPAGEAGLRAAELMLAEGMGLVRSVTGLAAPLGQDWPAYLLLETDDLPELAPGVDAAVDPRLWEYRERHTEAVATLGVVHKLDVSVPPGRTAAFLAQVPEVCAPHRVVVWGHLGDGNLHVNVAGPDAGAAVAGVAGNGGVDEAVLRLAASHDGSIAAEHGIGVAKAGYLGLSRSAAEIAAMRAVKAALDPQALLNPGVLFPLSDVLTGVAERCAGTGTPR